MNKYFKITTEFNTFTTEYQLAHVTKLEDGRYSIDKITVLQNYDKSSLNCERSIKTNYQIVNSIRDIEKKILDMGYVETTVDEWNAWARLVCNFMGLLKEVVVPPAPPKG